LFQGFHELLAGELIKILQMAHNVVIGATDELKSLRQLPLYGVELSSCGDCRAAEEEADDLLT